MPKLLRCRRYLAIAALLAVPLAASAAGIEEKAQMCDACHGEQGVPQEKTTPIIWGQHQGYLYLQLRDYKRGDRRHEQMSPVVEMFEREELLALAEVFSKKPWPRNTQPAAAEPVARTAERANTAVGCTGCHQGQFQGEGTQPRLAGQMREYLEKTMLETRSGERGNNPGMTTLMKATSESDIAALAQYLAGLTVTQ